MNELKAKETFNKYIIALQDINRIDKLETILQNKDKKNMEKLRKNRITDCHYLDDTDSTSLVEDKRTVLLDKMKGMSTSVEKLFNKKYPGLVKNIMGYIAPKITTPTQSILDDINDWWD